MSTLYHYTTPAGFQGILHSKGIWVTDTRFLNDRDEFKTGWDVFREVFNSRTASIQRENSDIYRLILGAMEGISITTAHVASFSQQGDMLSRWRGYNGGYGFSLGFDSQALNSATQAQNFEMSPVIYNRSEHLSATQAAFDLLISLLHDDNRTVEHCMLVWWRHVLKLVTVLKNSHFMEEVEYRIYAGAAADTEAVKIRFTPRALIPYLQMQLDQVMLHHKPHANLGLQEIIVGPAMNPNQIAAAELLLKHHGIEVPVRPSSIPYIGT